MIVRSVLASLSLMLVSTYGSSAFASKSKVKAYYQLLKSFPRQQINDKGKVCERIAEIEIKADYPDHSYEVIPNVVYYNKKMNVIGELDLLVVENKTEEVVLVGEVKCRTNLRGAAREGRQQLERFGKILGDKGEMASKEMAVDISDTQGPCRNFAGSKQCVTLWTLLTKGELGDGNDEIVFLSATHESRYFKSAKFSDEVEFRLISQKQPNANRYGFMTLSLSMGEVENLTRMLTLRKPPKF